MTKRTEAVYSQGVLKPSEDLGLREDQRVRLIVETVDDQPVDRAAALAKLKAGIAQMQFFSQGPLPCGVERDSTKGARRTWTSCSAIE